MAVPYSHLCRHCLVPGSLVLSHRTQHSQDLPCSAPMVTEEGRHHGSQRASLKSVFKREGGDFTWLPEQLQRNQAVILFQKPGSFPTEKPRTQDQKTSRDHVLSLPGKHPSEISHGEGLGGKENHIILAFVSQEETQQIKYLSCRNNNYRGSKTSN